MKGVLYWFADADHDDDIDDKDCGDNLKETWHSDI